MNSQEALRSVHVNERAKGREDGLEELLGQRLIRIKL